MGSLLNRRLINLAATHRGAADFVQVGPAYVEPFRLLQVDGRAARERIPSVGARHTIPETHPVPSTV